MLRLAQGFGVGGEWGGAVLMAVEHAPAGARGFYGSWPQIGVPAGLLLSTAVFALFARLPEEQFLSWGWRVPFLLSILLVGVGLIIRLRILETPAFTRIKEARTEARLPIVELLQTQRKQVLLAIGARLAENGAFYIYTVFVLVYGTQKVGIDRQTVLNGVLIAAACALVAIPFCGALVRSARHDGRSTCSAPASPRCSRIRCSGCSTPDRRPWCGLRSSWRSCSRIRRCTDRRRRSWRSCSARASATAARRLDPSSRRSSRGTLAVHCHGAASVRTRRTGVVHHRHGTGHHRLGVHCLGNPTRDGRRLMMPGGVEGTLRPSRIRQTVENGRACSRLGRSALSARRRLCRAGGRAALG